MDNLLASYERSIGSSAGGIPTELYAGAPRVSDKNASVLAAGSADCIDRESGNPMKEEGDDADATTYSCKHI